MANDPAPSKRICFVTVGATAAFDCLVEAVLSQPFLQSLSEANYTGLLVQYGSGRAAFETCARRRGYEEGRICGINVDGFDFRDKGLFREMQLAKGESSATEGVVVSHAGMLCST